MIYYQGYSSSSSTNNIKVRGHSWNHPTAAGTPSGMDLDKVGGNWLQSGTPHGTSKSERVPSGNNLTLAGNLLGMNLLNG